MRLRKVINIITMEKEIVDYDALGDPVYETVETYHPIKCEVEPFSNKLAEESYGVFVDATNRVFSKPNELIIKGAIFEYDDSIYEVTEPIKYDKHYETMVKYVGDVDD